MPLIFPTLLHAWLPLTKTTGNEGAHPATTCLCRRANTRADVRLEGRGASCLPAALGGAEIGIHPPRPASVRLCSLHCRKGSTVGASKPSKGACEERSRMDRLPLRNSVIVLSTGVLFLPPKRTLPGVFLPQGLCTGCCLGLERHPISSPTPPSTSTIGFMTGSVSLVMPVLSQHCCVLPGHGFFFFFAPTGFLKHKNSHTMSSPCPAESGIQNFCRTNHCT